MVYSGAAFGISDALNGITLRPEAGRVGVPQRLQAVAGSAASSIVSMVKPVNP